jgi:hypothetical protein
MRSLVLLIVALGITIAFTIPTFAGDEPTTKADCEKAGKRWDSESKTCTSANGY